MKLCQTGCPAGYHSERWACDLSCGACNGNRNSSQCEPNCGTQFKMCYPGFNCPTGWVQTKRECSFDCGNCPSSTANTRTCTRILDSMQTLTKCDPTCPAGWTMTRAYCSLNCGSCPGTNNTADCSRN